MLFVKLIFSVFDLIPVPLQKYTRVLPSMEGNGAENTAGPLERPGIQVGSGVETLRGVDTISNRDVHRHDVRGLLLLLLRIRHPSGVDAPRGDEPR